jgi:hypothetical protein
VVLKEKGREHYRWMEILQGESKMLLKLVMPKIQLMLFYNYEAKGLFQGGYFIS